MNRVKNLLVGFTFSLLVLALPTIASAQWGNNNRNNGGYGQNGGYYNNDQLKSTLKRLERDSKDFEKFVKRENNDRYTKNNYLNKLTSDFKKAADRLESRFDSRNLYKSQNEAQTVLNLANQLDREVRRSRLSYNTKSYWNNMQGQINEVANAYRYNNNNNRNNNNRNNRNNRNNSGWGDWRNKLPF